MPKKVLRNPQDYDNDSDSSYAPSIDSKAAQVNKPRSRPNGIVSARDYNKLELENVKLKQEIARLKAAGGANGEKDKYATQLEKIFNSHPDHDWVNKDQFSTWGRIGPFDYKEHLKRFPLVYGRSMVKKKSVGRGYFWGQMNALAYPKVHGFGRIITPFQIEEGFMTSKKSFVRIIKSDGTWEYVVRGQLAEEVREI